MVVTCFSAVLGKDSHCSLGRGLEKPPYTSVRNTENWFGAGAGSYWFTRVNCVHLFPTLNSGITDCYLKLGNTIN